MMDDKEGKRRTSKVIASTRRKNPSSRIHGAVSINWGPVAIRIVTLPFGL